MKTFAIISFLATTLSVVSKTFADPDPNFHIYLAFGQSNMEGQGPIEAQDRTADSRFQMLSTVDDCNGHKLGKWYDAVPPLSSCYGKLGPGDYFGRTLVKNLPEQIKVGIAVVAVAGCDIQLFEKNNYKSYNLQSFMVDAVRAYNGNPYGRLIEMGKIAKEAGVIKGILLHQGETNNGQQNWPNRVKAVYEDILKDLDLRAEDVPLLAGEVVQSNQNGICGGMNSIIQKLPQTIPTAHVISSEGLVQQGDGYHFTSASYRTLGQRYAEEMLKILGDVKVVEDKPDEPTVDDSCWSTALGYPCCTTETTSYYSDDDGDWSIENGSWCGIKKICWAEALGYKCCSTNTCRNVVASDNDGKWDIENNDWCGISTANTIC